MELCLNGRENIVEQLKYHNTDQYSYWPTSRDEWVKGGWLDWDFYMVGILTFKRNELGLVNGSHICLGGRRSALSLFEGRRYFYYWYGH